MLARRALLVPLHAFRFTFFRSLDVQDAFIESRRVVVTTINAASVAGVEVREVGPTVGAADSAIVMARVVSPISANSLMVVK